MDRLAPFDKIGVTPVPDHQNADPANGVQGSILNVLIFNQLQREGVNLEALAGLTPSSTDLTQWTQAVSRGGIWAGALTGTGDLAVATLGATLPALLQGMRVGTVATASNTVTNPKLRVSNLGTTGGYTDFPILKEDGSALAAGDIKAGRRYRFEADGSGNVMITGGGLGSGLTSITQISQGLLAAIKTTSFTNATQTALSNNVQVPLVWGDASTADFTNNGTNGFTCNTAGGYLIDLAGVVSTSVTASSANDCSNQILKNGASVPGGFGKSSYTATSSGTWVQYVHAFAFAVLAVGDIIKAVEGVSVGSGFGNANGSGHTLILTKIF